MPKISIVVPCYKQAEYLPDALNSVLNQTYTDWECIIVNDGSPDNTESVAKKFCELDSRFIYLHKNNGGLSSARNAGINKSNGEYILPLDADDKISTDYIELGLSVIQGRPDIKLVYCKAELFGEQKGEWLLPEYKYYDILLSNMIFCSAIYRRKDYDQAGGYNTSMTKGWEDWDFWLTLLNETDYVYRIEKICFYYRVKNESMIKSMSSQIQEELYLKIYNNHREKYEQYINPIIVYKQLVQITKEIDSTGKLLKMIIKRIIARFSLFFS